MVNKVGSGSGVCLAELGGRCGHVKAGWVGGVTACEVLFL
jgi:hypothetical protein